ncbi:MAG: DUF2167 domain-containing protein [Agriterribacter sp.]
MKPILASLFLALLCLTVKANGDDSTKVADAKVAEALKQIAEIEKKLTYKTGAITLDSGLATINIPEGYKFLGPADAKYIVEDVWGNLKGQAPLGMIIPADQMASIADYAFIVEYEEMGYVKDGDADDINYDDLLKNIQEDQVKANEERKAQGIPAMHLVGWAEKPYYDKNKKVLYWAKDLTIDGNTEHTLNYDIRVLGRKGVLILQAVGSLSSLDSVNKSKSDILNMVSFNTGNKYSDYNSSTDNVAAWTIGGLVAGKLLAKVGFFALILKNIKLIAIAIAAGGGALWRFITGRKKKEETLAYEQPAAPTDESTNA